MKRLSRMQWTLVIAGVIVAVLYVGWKTWDIYRAYREINEFAADSGVYMNEITALWSEYGARPQSYYEAFAHACDSLLDAYEPYTDYPYYIPIENNPAVPDIIASTHPVSIKVVSGSRIRVNLGQFRDAEEMGFFITWQRGSGASGDLYVGTGLQDRDPVYSR